MYNTWKKQTIGTFKDTGSYCYTAKLTQSRMVIQLRESGTVTSFLTDGCRLQALGKPLYLAKTRANYVKTYVYIDRYHLTWQNWHEHSNSLLYVPLCVWCEYVLHICNMCEKKTMLLILCDMFYFYNLVYTIK